MSTDLGLPRTSNDAPEPKGIDLLQFAPVKKMLNSKYFPKILQIPVAAVFGLIAFELLAGPSTAHDNPGTALMWVLWWPLIPIVFLFLGRFWCAICPFATLSDFVQKLVGANRPVPAFLKKYGIWIIDGSFIAITWADHVFGIVSSPWGSGILLLLITLAVIVSGAFFQRRTFCRYLCFLGGLSGNYARTGMIALRADANICQTCTSKAACFNGTDKAPACPLFVFPRTMDSNANCILCANCIKNCPNDAITVSLRPPTRELWFIKNPRIEESFLAMAIMGIVLIQNITMLSIWSKITDFAQRTTGISNSALIFTIAFVTGVTFPVALLALGSRIGASRNSENWIANFARFGYALIPFDVAGHVAHNLFHLLAEGKSIFNSVANLFGSNASGSAAIASSETIQILQFVILVLGFVGSMYAVKRISARRYTDFNVRNRTATPYYVIVAVLVAINIYLFMLPMAHRM